MRCFIYAAEGISYTLKTCRNMRIHLAAAFYVVTAGFVCEILPWQWCAVMLCISLVMALECMNTAIECTCNAITTEHNENIKRAKDASAGAVLCAAVLSAAVGGFIFFRADKIDKVTEFIKSNPIGSAVIVLTVPLWIIYIFMRRSNICKTSQKTQ